MVVFCPAWCKRIDFFTLSVYFAALSPTCFRGFQSECFKRKNSGAGTFGSDNTSQRKAKAFRGNHGTGVLVDAAAHLQICSAFSSHSPFRDHGTTFIAYGAYTDRSQCDEEKLNEWYTQFNVNRGDYYLIVGRFVPENNYETMITEFMRSKTEKDLVIITNVEHNKFYEQLREKTGFEKDKRIKFVGTVYDQDLLKKIREEAYGYLHGHEVGGTNPSLLEALASTRLNLLLGVGFNKEVGEDSALYWSKDSGNLAALLEQADALDADTIALLDKRSTDRVRDAYSWEKIVGEYEKTFLEG